MGPKRVLSEQQKAKRRQTSREWRAKKARGDQNWHAKEAARVAKLYVPKEKYSKEEWEKYKAAKREGMTRHRMKKATASNPQSTKSVRHGKSTGRKSETEELPSRLHRPTKGSTVRTTAAAHVMDETPSTCATLRKNTVYLPAVMNRCQALKRQLGKKEKKSDTFKRTFGKLRRQLSDQEAAEVPTTSVKEAHQRLNDSQKKPTQSALKRVIPYTAPLPTKRKLLSPSSPNKVKKGLLSKTPTRYICRPFKYRSTKKLITESQKNLAVAFLKRPDNSSQLLGKKHHIRGQVKYGLTDTMENLYRKFKSEYTSIQMSRSVFFGARPKYIKLVQWTNRNQCLCQICANMSLLIDATKVLPKSGKTVSDMSDQEVRAKLSEIASIVTFKQWGKVDVNFKGNIIKKTKRINVTLSKADFKATFLNQLHVYRKHCQRVETQYAQLRVLKQKMKPMVEATVQCDYAENWECGSYQDEISAVFYDQNMITLHPMVVHFRNEVGNLQHISFVGLTEEEEHCATTTYAFIKAFIPKLQSHLPNLEVLHYVTDSLNLQYRNKTIAAILSRHASLFGVRASWTYLETGHGKGPCDGVGGCIKKMADNAVKKGVTIATVEEFNQVIGEKDSEMTLIRVTSEDIKETQTKIALWDIIPCDGIGSAHALWPVSSSMMIRETSCFEDCCYEGLGKFHPSCQGWQRTNVKVLEAHDQPTQSTDHQPLPVNTL